MKLTLIAAITGTTRNQASRIAEQAVQALRCPRQHVISLLLPHDRHPTGSPVRGGLRTRGRILARAAASLRIRRGSCSRPTFLGMDPPPKPAADHETAGPRVFEGSKIVRSLHIISADTARYCC